MRQRKNRNGNLKSIKLYRRKLKVTENLFCGVFSFFFYLDLMIVSFCALNSKNWEESVGLFVCFKWWRNIDNANAFCLVSIVFVVAVDYWPRWHCELLLLLCKHVARVRWSEKTRNCIDCQLISFGRCMCVSVLVAWRAWWWWGWCWSDVMFAIQFHC